MDDVADPDRLELEAGEIVSDTVADAERRLIAEVAFLNAARDDERIRLFLDAWADALQLPEGAEQLLQAARAEDASPDLERIAEEICTEVLAAFASAEQIEKVAETAQAVCEAMGCRWPWLAMALVRAVWWRLIWYLDGDDAEEREIGVELLIPSAPPIGKDGPPAWRSSESLEEAKVRMLGLFEQLERSMPKGLPPGRRVTDREREQIERDAGFLYRFAVKSPRDYIREAAREMGRGEWDASEAARKKIQAGMGRAQALLGVVSDCGNTAAP